MAPALQIFTADLSNPSHAEAIVALTNAYAEDDMGNGGPLPAEVLQQLIPGLREHPTTLILLAYLGEEPVGIATCFLGFSTFAARPLVNIHDLAVLPEYRGRGFGRALLAAVEAKARELGCVKVTLEVMENNYPARHLYAEFGFAQATYTDSAGAGLFYSKSL